ncbi:MAG: AMP-binding protein [Lentisphaerae bacterium]|nr:AMP-binding protein [Lentisphaerota bacterium]
MSLLSRFLKQTEFSSYEDFYRNFQICAPEHFNFAYDVLDVYADEEPERVALVWCDDRHDQDQTITFGDLRQRTNRVANMLQSCGIGRGDAVMLILKSRHEFWPVLMALHKLGAIGIPATHMLKEHDISYRIEKASVKAILAVDSNDLLEQVDRAQQVTGGLLQIKISLGGERPGWLSYQQMYAASSAEFPTPPRSERNANTDILLIYFTSGTAGFPKMVVHDHQYPLAHILTAKYWQNVEEGGLHYTVADCGWAKAVWGKLYGQWLSGAAVFVYDYDKFEAANMLRTLIRYGVTSFCAPPTVYRFLIKEDLSQYDLSCLKYAVVAGEPLNPEVYNRFLEKTGLRLMEAFGQTELVVTTANWPWMTPKPGSMGKPSPGYQVELLDWEGHRVEVGEEGEICLKTSESLPPGIFHGYYRDQERTQSVWYDGYYHTGDVAWQDEEGYLWYVGRSDDVIKSSGYRIGPFEVESVLMQHPAVTECAVTGVPDPVRGQVVKATVVLSRGYQPSDELRQELQGFVKANTAPYKYPRIVDFVAAMPKTISGKIRRVELRESAIADSGTKE